MKRYIKAAVISFENTPMSVKEHMASDPNTRPEILMELAGHTYYSHPMVAALLRNPNITPDVLEKMIRCVGDDTWSIGEILRHPKTPESAAAYVGHYASSVHALETLITAYDNLPAELLAELHDHDSPKIRKLVAQHPDTPPNVLTQMATDPSKLVRFWVAQNPNTPETTKRRLAGDFDDIGGTDYWDEQEALAKDPRTPSEFLRHLADTSNNGMAISYVASNPSTPADILQRLGEDYFHQGRVAENPSAPPELLDKLSRCHDVHQRRTVAANPNASPATLKRLAKSTDWRTRDAAAGNPNTPNDVLRRLMRVAEEEDDRDLQYIISNNPSYKNH